MTDIRIKEIREKAGMTQQQLADQVNCTIEHIQRIEGGHEAVKFLLALEICRVLDSELKELFPKSRRTLQEARKGDKKVEDLLADENLRKGMEDAGIDMFSGIHFFKYRLRGGTEGILEITSQEKDRLWRNLQDVGHENTPFVSFYSGNWCVLLNLDHLLFCHLLFDFTESRQAPAYAVEVFLSDRETAIEIEVERDDINPEDPDELGQIGMLIVDADTMVEEGEFWKIEDLDCETAFFRAEDVAMLKVPLWVFNEDLEIPDDDETGRRAI